MELGFKPLIIVNPYLTNQSNMNSTELVGEIVGIMNEEGNETCFDCEGPSVEYANFSFGVLVCDQCAQLHSTLLSVDRRDVKPLFGCYWSEEEVALLKHFGNLTLKTDFSEYCVLTKSVRDKYTSRIGNWQRNRVKAWRQGEEEALPRPARNLREVLGQLELKYNQCEQRQKKMERQMTNTPFIQKLNGFFEGQVKVVEDSVH